MADIWHWIQSKHYDARLNDNEMQLRMIELFWSMLNVMEDDPTAALNYCMQSRRLAETLDDKWFIQLLNHWELQARFSFLGDYTGTLELATKATVEVRLPEYQALPQRVCLHEDLISAYVEQDPIGNKDLVQKALDYMEEEVDQSVECYKCLQGLKLDFVETHGTPEETIQAGLKVLGVVEGSAHHLVFAYITLVQSAYEAKLWDRMLLWSIELESNARKADRDNYIATSLLWLAIHAQRNQDDNRAQSLFQQAEHRANRYGAFIGKHFYTATTAYHEMGGRLQDALNAQIEYLGHVVGKTKPYEETTTYIEIIRLKKALNLDFADEVTKLKTRIKDLKAQDYMLDQLAQVTQ